MPRRIICSALIGSLVQLCFLAPGATEAAVQVPISAPSAILMEEASSRILFSKTPYRKRPPASTTKVLTAMVVMDHLALERIVSIPSFVVSIQPSKAYLRPGERYRVRDLLRAMLISSSNDAAEVLAHATAGSRTAFAILMNRKARSIGCKHSHFVRPSGLPAKGQYATAYDLALIMKAAERYSFIVKTLAIKRTAIYSLEGRKIYLKNHNKWLWRDPRKVIGKTGWTRRARYCFVGLISRPGRDLFIAMLGSSRLWKDLQTLVDYWFGKSWRRVHTNRKLWGRHETKKIQTALKNAGFDPGPIDGIFGPMTVAAVEWFQEAKGLDPDGIVGPLTWRKLRSYL